MPATDKAKTKLSPGASGLASSLPVSPVVPKTYAESTPLSRRQQIIEKVSQIALELETVDLQTEKTIVSGKLDPVPEEQPLLHTTRMWEWVESAGFYKKAGASSSSSTTSRRRSPGDDPPLRLLLLGPEGV